MTAAPRHLALVISLLAAALCVPKDAFVSDFSPRTFGRQCNNIKGLINVDPAHCQPVFNHLCLHFTDTGHCVVCKQGFASVQGVCHPLKRFPKPDPRCFIYKNFDECLVCQ